MDGCTDGPGRQTRGESAELPVQEDISEPQSCHRSWCTPSAVPQSTWQINYSVSRSSNRIQQQQQQQ